MSEWIDVPELKPGDCVVIGYIDPARIAYTIEQPTGDYLIGYWDRRHDLWERSFVSVTSLQVSTK